ncbi:MAG: thioredoxin fold domain-containing protein [Pyrinomonadaceae bacterium]|nr:thioredoxin fold domain-containing protein [Pyrinomonadaceae bacterium]MDQ3134695.1 cytochrome c oxidase assembly factor Coa1 family protein [Acidobacteriota bacterium]
MTTRKTVLLIVGILAGLSLLVVLFAGAITGFVFYSIGNSEAARTAKTFLRKNEKLKSEVGEVRDFGWFVTGQINSRNNDGNAALSLKVIGVERTVNAMVQLAYRNDQSWRVTGAAYEDEAGKMVELLEKYETDEGSDENVEAPSVSPLDADVEDDGRTFSSPETDSPSDDSESDAESPITQVSASDFAAEALRPGAPTLVYFWAEWCGPCRKMKPGLTAVAENYEGRARVVAVNVDESSALTQRYAITGIPTLLLMKDGKEIERIVGGVGENAISNLLNKHLTE